MKRLLLIIIMLGLMLPARVSSQAVAGIKKGQVEVLQEIQIHEPLFTQGLELSQAGDLYLGTGRYEESRVGILDLEEGRLKASIDLADSYFGEGITLTQDALWQLTWKRGVVFKRSLDDLAIMADYTYPGEGWGLAYDPDRDLFWMSDGSSYLFQQDPQNFQRLKELPVTLKGQPVDRLNELEYANQALYANVWYDNHILKIDPLTGQVQVVYDMSPVLDSLDLTEDQLNMMDALNGIAHIEGDRFYITGKYYPFLLEVRLIDKDE